MPLTAKVRQASLQVEHDWFAQPSDGLMPGGGQPAPLLTAPNAKSGPVWPANLLAPVGPRLRQALSGAKEAGAAYVVIDGTLTPSNRVVGDRPFCSSEHRRLGMNLRAVLP